MSEKWVDGTIGKYALDCWLSGMLFYEFTATQAYCSASLMEQKSLLSVWSKMEYIFDYHCRTMGIHETSAQVHRK